MENKVTGVVTRSQVLAGAGRPSSETTCVTTIPRSEVVATSTRSRSSRASREALRLRAEYEAEKELTRLREELIKKKLALDIAEIEDEVADDNVSDFSGPNNVEDWLNTNEALKECVVKPPSPHTQVLTCPSERKPREITTTHALSKDAAAAAPTTPHVVPPAPHAAPPGLTTTTAATSDIMHLADVIITNMSRRPLPSYDLPVFDGNPVDWLSYRRTYDETAPTYNMYENTRRLQASLRGTARSAVEDLLRTGTDPIDVINALEEEFGHPNLLLESVLKKIRSLPRVSDSGIELRNMTCVVRNCVYILQNIKAQGYINNPQMIQEILCKLTPVQRSQYGEFVLKKNTNRLNSNEDLRVSPNINIVLEFLSHLSRATAYYLPLSTMNTDLAPRNRSTAVTTAPAEATVVNKMRASRGDLSRRHSEHTHRVHVISEKSTSSSTSSSPTVCALCDSAGHRLPECDKFVNKSEQEKWDFVKQNKLCFKCLVQNHSRYRCRAKRCDKCRAPHHALLHYEKSGALESSGAAAATIASAGAGYSRTPTAASEVRAVQSSPNNVESVTCMGERYTKTLLKIIPVSIMINNVEYNCYALLDDGATVSLIDSSVCNMSGPLSPLKIVSARGHVVTDKNSCRVTALIRGPNDLYHDITLRTIDNLDLPTQSVPARVLAMNKHLRELDFCEMSCAKPMILIGQDNWQLVVNQEIRQGKSGQPVASLTKLGWVVHGPVGICDKSDHESVNLIYDDNLDNLSELVKQQFLLESIGITEVSRKNAETERACKILDSTSRRVDGGWEVGLLWSRDDVHLPDNYDYTYKRLRGIENKMDKNPDYAEGYSRQVERLISEKYARLLHTPPCTNPLWYLPHFGVTNPNKPNKLRLVYDAAAKYKGACLNDYLLTGPDLLNTLLGVLFKFRSGPIAYTADIADMFLRIKIRKEDQGAQLFLWRGQDRKRDPDVYVMDSMIFGAKSSPTSAIYVLNKNASEFQDSYPEAVNAIHNNHYMDDYLDSVDSVDRARRLVKEVSMIHSAGGFSIRGWVTNSPELRKELPSVVPGTVNFDKSPYSAERTLGMIWVPESDDLAFDLSFKKVTTDVVEGRVIPTKRQFLRFIMSIFDPLGLLCPYTIKSKILLQKIWKSGIGWDQQLKEDEFKAWERWLQDIKQLSSMRIPRWYGIHPVIELHVFGDASEAAYAAVAYLVGRNVSGKPTVSLVIGKARVAPLKVISVPRLELQAAVLACRLANTIIEEQDLTIARKYLWSDSKTVLKWIHSDPRDYQKFVSHRLAEIDQKSDPSDWRWVPSADNPADEATKLCWPTSCKLWFTGPSFLYQDKNFWPTNEFDDATDVDSERLEKVHLVKEYEPLFKVDRFSSWTRAIRCVGRVLAFLGICRKHQVEKLTAGNIRDAKILLLKQSQMETFSKELTLLKNTSALSVDSKIRNLDPFIYEGDGLLRVRGRLSLAPDLMFNEKFPIILDGRTHIARLIIRDFHERAHHANTDTVINSIREQFWITQLRRTVKTVVSKCQFCRIRHARPSLPKMGDLPAARLTNTRRAFVHCGVDYFGPMEVTIGRRHEKRWGVIFTCLVTRAVHLEIASSLSADSAIMAIRRLIARRGQPQIIFSDRGTNFVGADAELRASVQKLHTGKLQDFIITKGISWQFNPPASPHMGGCWERLVRSVKAALKVTLTSRAPKEELLMTLMAEVEMTLNSRPLTFVGSDPDGPIALTPNHLLIGTPTGTSTLGIFNASDLNCRKAWVKAQALADMFWRRWLREYVPTLQKRQKWLHEVSPVKVGDMVLILEDNQPRNTWNRGVISAVHPGRDGQIRVVTIKTSRGLLKRPVVKVIVLPTDELVQERGGEM